MIEATTLAKSDTSGVIGALKTLPRALQSVNWIELLMALLTIGIIYGFKYITKKVPSTLVALFVVSLGAYFLKLDYRPIQAIPEGLPLPHLDIFSEFKLGEFTPYIFTAITLAFLGAIDSLLTSVVADNMTKTKHNPNQELLGQGIGNSVAAIFGGLPGAGATIRTVVNINAGGTTRLSGLIAAVLLFLVLIAAGPIASQIPAAVLAGILVTVGIGVMDYKGLKAIPRMEKTEVSVMLVVMLLSVFWNLVYAVGIGLVLASLIFMKKIGDLTAMKSKVIKLEDADELDVPWRDEMNFPSELKRKVFIKRLKGPLFFGYTSDFQELSKEIPKEATHVIIRMGEVPYMDQSGLYAMEEVLLDLRRRNVQPIFEDLQDDPSAKMQSIDIIPDLVPQELVFKSFKEAAIYIKENVRED